MKILIDPRCMFDYASFYIQGLYELYGTRNVCFTSNEFKEVSYDYYRIMCYKVIDGKSEKHVVVDYQDFNTIVQDAYDWCDVYAKINVRKDDYISGEYKKLLCITPGFGIQIFGLFRTCWQALKNTCYIYMNGWNLYGTKRMYIRSYLSNWYHGVRLKSYLSESCSSNKYIFFISTLWNINELSVSTNRLRAKFIRVCKSLGIIHFEGGLFANPTNPYYTQYRDVVFKKRYSRKDYIRLTKSSSIVFNVPTVHGCHGWKLGEFLAMGKAIISMPLSNHLAFPLTNGVNIRFCETEDEIENAILDLINDDHISKNMRQAARQYFTDYATPQKVIGQIHDKVFASKAISLD